MALEVIGAGSGRTGTNSLKLALELLGYEKCHHMKEVILSAEQLGYWEKISLGERVDWDAVFDGFTASVDWPSSAFYQELAEHYPEAKVVLGIRDPDGWHKSTRETIYAFSYSIPSWIKLLYRRAGRFEVFVNRLIWHGIFEKKFEDKEFATKIFLDHIEEVKRSIAPERLLVHQPQDGWQPLCEFLGKPIPDAPYPRVNEAKEMKRALVVLKWLDRLPWAVLVLIAAALVYFLV